MGMVMVGGGREETLSQNIHSQIQSNNTANIQHPTTLRHIQHIQSSEQNHEDGLTENERSNKC